MRWEERYEAPWNHGLQQCELAFLEVAAFHWTSAASGAPGQMNSYPDPEWVQSIMEALEHAALKDLVARATTDRLVKAGNVGGELLNWIAMLGAIGEHRPSFLEQQSHAGHAYAAWHIA